MDRLPIELCEIIALNLPFEAINTFARTCRRLAKLMFDRRDELALQFAKCEDFSLEFGIDMCVDSLPNGVRHGRITALWDTDYEFHVEYAFGEPSHWTIIDQEVDNYGMMYRGHVDTRIYIENVPDDCLSARLIIRTSTINHIMSCGSTCRDKEPDRPADYVLIKDRLPPQPFLVDGKLAFESVEEWGSKYMRDTGIVAVAPDIFWGDGLLGGVVEHFPGVDFEKCFGVTL